MWHSCVIRHWWGKYFHTGLTCASSEISFSILVVFTDIKKNPNPGTHKTLILYFCPVIDIYISVWTCFHEAFCLPHLEFNLPAPYLQCPGCILDGGACQTKLRWFPDDCLNQVGLWHSIENVSFLCYRPGKNMLSNPVRNCKLFIYLALKFLMSVKGATVTAMSEQQKMLWDFGRAVLFFITWSICFNDHMHKTVWIFLVTDIPEKRRSLFKLGKRPQFYGHLACYEFSSSQFSKHTNVLSVFLPHTVQRTQSLHGSSGLINSILGVTWTHGKLIKCLHTLTEGGEGWVETDNWPKDTWLMIMWRYRTKS